MAASEMLKIYETLRSNGFDLMNEFSDTLTAFDLKCGNDIFRFDIRNYGYSLPNKMLTLLTYPTELNNSLTDLYLDSNPREFLLSFERDHLTRDVVSQLEKIAKRRISPREIRFSEMKPPSGIISDETLEIHLGLQSPSDKHSECMDRIDFDIYDQHKFPFHVRQEGEGHYCRKPKEDELLPMITYPLEGLGYMIMHFLFDGIELARFNELFNQTPVPRHSWQVFSDTNANNRDIIILMAQESPDGSSRYGLLHPFHRYGLGLHPVFQVECYTNDLQDKFNKILPYFMKSYRKLTRQ